MNLVRRLGTAWDLPYLNITTISVRNDPGNASEYHLPSIRHHVRRSSHGFHGLREAVEGQRLAGE